MRAVISCLSSCSPLLPALPNGLGPLFGLVRFVPLDCDLLRAVYHRYGPAYGRIPARLQAICFVLSYVGDKCTLLYGFQLCRKLLDDRGLIRLEDRLGRYQRVPARLEKG